MFIIKNKIRIFSAVILAISTAATVLSSCGENIPEIPVETVIGTNGEILGVSVYTEENESDTQTILYEITTKKKSIFGKKDKEAENDTSVQSSEKMTVRNDSPGVTVTSRQPKESTSRVRVTFPQTKVQKTTRAANSVGEKDEQATKHIPVSYAPQSNAPKTTKKAVSATVKQTQQINSTTKKAVSNEIINDEANGISVVFKTASVERGDTASVMIQGDPGQKYSIDFYVSPTDTANLSALESKTADENGFVTWSFSIPISCESGNRKVVVKESNSDKYAQTTITVK